jgi:hypothetical protein
MMPVIGDTSTRSAAVIERVSTLEAGSGTHADGRHTEGGLNAVNAPRVEVHRRLDARAKDVLRGAGGSAAGVLVDDLVKPQVLAVSRTLRRLWQRGLVELHDSRWAGMGRTMSDKQRQRRGIAARAQANPEAFYREALRFRTVVTKHDHDPWGSADACVAEKVRLADAVPTLRVRRVTATTLGRELLERSGTCGEVHRESVSEVQTPYD